jgi:phospholipase/lecithinase/hemolysin
MYWTLTLLVCFSVTSAFQTNINPLGLFNRFQFAAIFGDSTSDTGNVYDLTSGTWPISPPYYYGRYCNGPNWADDLNVLVKYNYAYGSATTDNNFVKGYAKLNTVLVPGMLQQVIQYLTDYNNSCSLNNPFSLNNIIVFNQEPFQNVPINSALNQPAQFIYLTSVVNKLINASLQSIKAANPSASIYLFDLHSFITYLLANPPYPVTNTVNYCWNDTSITTVGVYCSNPNTNFFIDNFHFTAPVQQKLADAVSQFFQYGFNPSPANYFYAY